VARRARKYAHRRTCLRQKHYGKAGNLIRYSQVTSNGEINAHRLCFWGMQVVGVAGAHLDGRAPRSDRLNEAIQVIIRRGGCCFGGRRANAG